MPPMPRKKTRFIFLNDHYEKLRYKELNWLNFFIIQIMKQNSFFNEFASLAQLGEHQTEDLKAGCSIHPTRTLKINFF